MITNIIHKWSTKKIRTCLRKKNITSTNKQNKPFQKKTDLSRRRSDFLFNWFLYWMFIHWITIIVTAPSYTSLNMWQPSKKTFSFFLLNFQSWSQAMGLSSQAFFPTHSSTMLHSLVYIKISMNHINQSNFIRAKFTGRTLKKWTNHLTPSNVVSEDWSKWRRPWQKLNKYLKWKN